VTLVVTLEDFRPSPRYDSLPWTKARIEEGTASAGPWTTLETINLSPVDSDPTNPAYRSFTTALGSAEDLWYRVVFLDAADNFALPTYPVQNVASDRPVYADVNELARILRINNPTAAQHAAMRRVLETASGEVDFEIGTADVNDTPLPYGDPPALVQEVTIERAVEHWRQQEVPWGVIGMGDTGATYIARDTWDRHAHKLAPLKGSWGIA
jgi:hypothetical protein